MINTTYWTWVAPVVYLAKRCRYLAVSTLAKRIWYRWLATPHAGPSCPNTRRQSLERIRRPFPSEEIPEDSWPEIPFDHPARNRWGRPTQLRPADHHSEQSVFRLCCLDRMHQSAVFVCVVRKRRKKWKQHRKEEDNKIRKIVFLFLSNLDPGLHSKIK